MIHEPDDERARQAFETAMQAGIRGDVNTEVAALNRAIELEPTCAFAHAFLGHVYYVGAKLTQSVSALSEAVRLEPRFAAAYVLRAQCFDRLGDGVKAVADRKIGLALPGPKHLDYPERFVISLYSRPFLDEARGAGIDIEAVLERIAQMPGAHVLMYPDGTVQLEGKGTTSTFEAEAGSLVRDRALQRAQAEDPLHMRLLQGGASFISLSPFPARVIGLALWGEFVKKYEGGHLRIQPGTVPLPIDGKANGPIENLPVTVAFHRRFSKKTRQELAELIAAYLASVHSEGLFSEGPITKASDEIRFYPRVAQFRINASRSGQNTINWLILSLVAFSNVNVVTEIHFRERLNMQWTFERYFELSEKDLVKVAVPEMSGTARATLAAPSPHGARVLPSDEEPKAEPLDTSELPSGTPYPGVASEHFPVLTTPRFSRENSEVTIYFEQLPRAGERGPFVESIRSWLRLGQLGAFGPPGFDHFTEVDIDPENVSAKFLCDFETADMNLAIQILVSTLEGWHAHGIVIKALVLGGG